METCSRNFHDVNARKCQTFNTRPEDPQSHENNGPRHSPDSCMSICMAEGEWIELELRHFTRELPLSNLPSGLESLVAFDPSSSVWYPLTLSTLRDAQGNYLILLGSSHWNHAKACQVDARPWNGMKTSLIGFSFENYFTSCCSGGSGLQARHDRTRRCCSWGQHHFKVAIETPDGWSDWSAAAP